MEMLQILKKLTVKALEIDPAALLPTMKEGDVRVVARMFGVAHKYKEAPSKFSTTDVPRTDYRFQGIFEGHNLLTGQVFNAPVCYLPGAAPEQLAAALDQGVGAVEFDVEIAIKKVKKRDGTDGYIFGVAVPKQPNRADPLEALRNRASAPALPAPEADAPEADAPEADEPVSPKSKGKGK